VVEPGDGEVGTEPLSERDSGALTLRHRQRTPVWRWQLAASV
jgi:hypothetical protein